MVQRNFHASEFRHRKLIEFAFQTVVVAAAVVVERLMFAEFVTDAVIAAGCVQFDFLAGDTI